MKEKREQEEGEGVENEMSRAVAARSVRHQVVRRRPFTAEYGTRGLRPRKFPFSISATAGSPRKIATKAMASAAFPRRNAFWAEPPARSAFGGAKASRSPP